VKFREFLDQFQGISSQNLWETSMRLAACDYGSY